MGRNVFYRKIVISLTAILSNYEARSVEMIFPGRVFKFWEYSPTHSSLLIRSPSIGHDGEINIDIIFKGVTYLRIPSGFLSPQIWECTEEESVLLDNEYPRSSSHQRWYGIKSRDQSYFVLAMVMFIEENTEELLFKSVFDEPDFWAGMPRS